MGIFEKFKIGFKKSASTFTSGLKEIILKKEIDDENLNKIEEFLIQSDVGIEAADIDNNNELNILDIVSIIDTGPGGTGSLEAGESASVTVNLADTGGGVTRLEAGTKFRIEMMAPKGGTLIVERDIPKVLTANMNLD